jgi:hypothetical protein
MIILPAIIEGIATRKDKTVRITIGTQELPPDKAGQLMSLQNAMSYVAIKAEDFSDKQKEDISQLETPLIGVKSKSQILRAELWKNWKENNEGFEKSEDHYNHYLDKITNYIITKR